MTTEVATPEDNEMTKQVLDFGPEFDNDRLFEIEACCTEHIMGQTRRSLLAILTLDSEALLDACEKEPEAFFDLFEKSADTVRRYRWLDELLSAAHSRLMIGLCSVDTSSDGAPFSKKAFHAAVTLATGEERAS